MSNVSEEKWPSRLRVFIPRVEGAEVQGGSGGVHEGHGRLYRGGDGEGLTSQD